MQRRRITTRNIEIPMMPNPSLEETRGDGHWTLVNSCCPATSAPLLVFVSVPTMKGGLIFQKGSLAAKKVNKAIGNVDRAEEFKEESPKLD